MLHRLILLFVAAALLTGPASAGRLNRTTLEREVAVVLTGSASGPVQTIDARSCVFAFNGGLVYFNNVALDRVYMEFQPSTLIIPAHLVVYLRGSAIVWDPAPAGPLLATKSAPPRAVPTYLEGDAPANEHAFVIWTTSKPRVANALRYIYTHGCHGQTPLPDPEHKWTTSDILQRDPNSIPAILDRAIPTPRE